MENVAVSQQGNDSKRAALLVLAGGLVAGTFDITYACVFWAIKAGARPTRIFQSVARGLLGPASFQGGAKTAALGLFLHYFIAITMSIFYYFAARKLTVLHKYPLRCGAVYGLGLFLVMTYIVVPLSRAGGGASPGKLWVVLSILVHMFLIGVPIAFFTRRAIESR
ncbi:MAG TPA: hypothetical protein VIK76_06920 [Pyrinomonadaceae bacterium]|jgi:hypothetical protein